MVSVRLDRGASGRIPAVVVAATAVILLFMATRLTPSEKGFGTHCQLGLAPCLVPVVTGYPCPTCGMTTAFSLAVRGRWIHAFEAQPAGLVFAAVVFAAALLTGYGAVTGSTWRPNPQFFSFPRIAVATVLTALIGWGLKVAFGIWSGTLPLW